MIVTALRVVQQIILSFRKGYHKRVSVTTFGRITAEFGKVATAHIPQPRTFPNRVSARRDVILSVIDTRIYSVPLDNQTVIPDPIV
jgi:hypothetical protein